MADQQLSTPKVQSLEQQRWHDSNPIEELFFSQKEVARFLELGYLALRDHPEVAAEIRNTAHKSRTQHVLTAGLFKKFVVTASSVVNTYCPMMLDAVELQDKDIVVEAFGQVLEMCLDMKKETEDARDSYLAIQEKVQQNLKTVNITNKKIKSEIEIMEQTKKSEEAQLAATEQQQAELEREQEELMKKVKTIETNRDEWLEKGAGFGDIKSLREAVTQLANVDKQFMKIMLFLGSMATMLIHLHQDQKAGGVYLKKIENEKYAEKFKLSIDKCEKTWNRIGIVCQNYVDVNDRVILEVYGFLSSPIDKWTEDQVKQRKESLIKEITDEVDKLDDVE